MEDNTRKGIFDFFKKFSSKDQVNAKDVESALSPSKDEEEQAFATDLSGFSNTSNMDLFGAASYPQWVNSVEVSKEEKLKMYRLMERYPYIDDAIDEIMTEAINVDSDDHVVKIHFDESRQFNENQTKNLEKEWNHIINDVLDIKTNMYTWFRDFLVTGEFASEHIINKSAPKQGIQRVSFLQAEKYIIRYDIDGSMEGFIVKNPYNKETRVVMDISQMSYINTGKFDFVEQQKFNNDIEEVERSKLVLSPLEKVKKVFRQLDALEDSIVIHRLARAPEKLVFNVDVGQLPKSAAERYLKRVIDKFRRKLSYDVETGAVNKVQNTKAIVEDYWFARQGDGKGTTVESIGGTGSLGTMEEVVFFLQKLYRALKIPYTRMPYPSNGGDNTASQADFNNGQVGSVTRDEIKFELFVRTQLDKFLLAVRQCYITHLKLKGIWDEYNLKPNDIAIKSIPSMFFTQHKESDELDARFNKLDKYGQYFEEIFSKELAVKDALDWTDKQWADNKAKHEEENPPEQEEEF